ncbi:caspase family protein [Kitasatospora sp. NPDC089913]|uniref:caspase family protein n=1 Tax=Kitasatospora sp. NPDC089913 TaxID=3364080 RepID=UPI0037F9A8FF
MGGFAALLIGASDYEGEEFITSLPFVPQDLERLDGALRARGFRVERPGVSGRTGWNFVHGEVTRFLEEAPSGATLLICLSGHGLHARGVDYLVPEDLRRFRKPPWKGCVAIDWRREIESSRAAAVLFLVDACREGVGDDTMGGAAAWPTRRARAVRAQQVARLYACAPGGLAHFATSGSGSFSLFSRAVLETLRSHDGELTLEQLAEAVQHRIGELHREHRKLGAPQEVRVLSDTDRTAFVVAGPLLEPAPDPVDEGPVDDEPVAADRPPAVPHLHDLVGRALFQWKSYGRTELLAEYAALGPTGELLDLAARLEDGAVAAMWDAAAGLRPVDPLLELVGALCAAGRSEVAHRILEAAAARPVPELPLVLAGLAALAGPVDEPGPAGLPADTVEALRSTLLRALAALPVDGWAACVVELHRAGLAAEAAGVSDGPRPVEDLPPLLAALDAEELPAEVERLVRARVARLGSGAVDGLLVELSRAGAVEARATALAAVAEWPVSSVAHWLRSARVRDGLDRDAASVVRALVSHREVRKLPRVFREAGLQRFLQLFREECAQREPRALHRLLDVLWHTVDRDLAPARADAVAVVRRAAEFMRPEDAGELTVLLCGHGPRELLDPFLERLCGEPPDRVAYALVRVWELPTVGRPDHDPVTAAVSVLGRRYPAEEVRVLLGELEQRRLSAVTARLRDALVRDRSTLELLTVLAEAPSTERDVFLRRILVLRREPGRLAELLDACGEERFASLGDPLARAVVAECEAAELAGVLVELRARKGLAGERLLRDRLEPVASTAAPAPPREPVPVLPPLPREPHRGPGPAPAPAPGPDPVPLRPAADRGALLGLAWRGSPGEVAELIVALDAQGPGAGAAVDVDELLRTFLDAGPVQRSGALIGALGSEHRGSRPGEQLVEALRAHAARLFAAARATGSEQGTSYLLDAFLGGPPILPPEFRALIGELRRTGGGREAGLLLERLGSERPPPVVVGLLEALRDDEAFEVLCRAAAGRPVPEVAEVLRNFRLERPRRGQAVQRFVEHLARATPPDRFAELLVELLVGRQGVVAGAVLQAARWTGSEEELGRLFTALATRGEEARGVAMDTLAPELSTHQADCVLAHLRRNGDEQLGMPLLRVGARRVHTPLFWAGLNERGWFRYAAALVDEAPPDAPLVAWYRQLHRTAPGLDRAALRREVGADGPVGELAGRAARGEPVRAALAAAALHRKPADVVGLLAALADRPPVRPGAGPYPDPAPRTAVAARQAELLAILAAARPPVELALILRALREAGRPAEAERIVDHLLADEPADRVAALLDTPLPVVGPTDRDPSGRSNGTAELLAGRMLAGDSVADVIGRLLRMGWRRSAEVLATELSARDRTGAEIARAAASLVDLAPELSHAMTVTVCRHRPPEHVADFLQHLDPTGRGAPVREAIEMVRSGRRDDDVAEVGRMLEQRGLRELAARLSGPAEPPGRRPRWGRRRH